MSLYDHCQANDRLRLLNEWDELKNLPLTPHNVSYGSKKKVWWHCEKGHRWQAMVKARTSGAGCPVCAHRRLLVGETT